MAETFRALFDKECSLCLATFRPQFEGRKGCSRSGRQDPVELILLDEKLEISDPWNDSGSRGNQRAGRWWDRKRKNREPRKK